MGSRSKFYRLMGLGDCDPRYASCDPAIYGVNGGYQPLPSSAVPGTGGSGDFDCDPQYQSCPDAIPGVTAPPIGSGGSVQHPGGAPGGYVPQIDYGPSQSFGGSSGIGVVIEGAGGAIDFLKGSSFGVPRWALALLGAAAVYKLSKGGR